MIIFVSLVQQMANESETNAKQQLCVVLKALLEHVEEDQFWQMLKMLEEWINCSNLTLQIAALQGAVSFILQTEHKFQLVNYTSFLKTISKHIETAIAQHTSVIRVSDYGNLSAWKTAYLSLIVLEKLFYRVGLLGNDNLSAPIFQKKKKIFFTSNAINELSSSMGAHCNITNIWMVYWSERQILLY